jgi:hypothetical protein
MGSRAETDVMKHLTVPPTEPVVGEYIKGEAVITLPATRGERFSEETYLMGKAKIDHTTR